MAGQKPAETSMAVRVNTIGDMLADRKQQIAASLPRHLDAGRMIRVFLTTIQKNPRLQECTLSSLYGALMQASQLGLEIDGVTGQGYIIPYNIKGVMTAVFQPGYRGLCELARRSGLIGKIWARVVYEKDEFSYQLGTDEWVKHIPYEKDDPGRVRLVYACAEFKDGVSPALRVMFPRDINKRRDASQSAHQSSSPWKLWEEEMILKTAIVGLARTLPASPELAEASGLAEMEHAPSAPMIQVDAEILDALDASSPAEPPKQVTQQASPAASTTRKKTTPKRTPAKRTPPEASQAPEETEATDQPDLSSF